MNISIGLEALLQTFMVVATGGAIYGGLHFDIKRMREEFNVMRGGLAGMGEEVNVMRGEMSGMRGEMTGVRDDVRRANKKARRALERLDMLERRKEARTVK